MPNEVTWRVSPEVFRDISLIVAKHGIGIMYLSAEESMELYGKVFGPDAAALEIREKYGLDHLPIGTQVKVVVDYKMTGYEKPEYEGEV